MRHINWSDITAKEPQPGVKTRRFDSDGMTIVKYTFVPHAAFPIHLHPEEQVVIMLRGQVTFTAGDETRVLQAGDISHVEPHVPHGAQAGDEGAEFLNLLSPRRVGETIVYR